MIEKIAELIINHPTVALTGAGVSTESGIPDFRSKNGLYSKYGKEIFDLDYFYKNPEKFYKFAKETFLPMYSASPNLTHKLLSILEEKGFLLGVITQNIDNLHSKAGTKKVVELHGNATKFYCTKCGIKYSINEVMKSYYCECGGLIRPNIIFFGENLPANAWEMALSLLEKAEIMLVIASSLSVYPAAYLPILFKRKYGKLIIVNNDDTKLDDLADFKINVQASIFSHNLLNFLKIKGVFQN
ncbi:MAG: NAD-dependent deacetylase [Thermosipho sp. (in: thermotogales)]|nr:NAD-dependent deacetylase [Thermosipho sp. (in: thermotogales)]